MAWVTRACKPTHFAPCVGIPGCFDFPRCPLFGPASSSPCSVLALFFSPIYSFVRDGLRRGLRPHRCAKLLARPKAAILKVVLRNCHAPLLGLGRPLSRRSARTSTTSLNFARALMFHSALHLDVCHVSPARADNGQRRQEQDDQRATQGAEIVSHTLCRIICVSKIRPLRRILYYSL